MAVGALNGWTADRLDALALDVDEIKKTLAKMQSEETTALKARVKELESRTGKWLLALGGPLLAVVVAEALNHALG